MRNWLVCSRYVPAVDRRPVGQDKAAAACCTTTQDEPRPTTSRCAQGARHYKVLDTILWVLRTGASWDDVPKEERFVAFQTAHRYLQNWVDEGTFQKIVMALAKEADLNLSECFIDGSFIPAKGGALRWATGEKAKARLSN